MFCFILFMLYYTCFVWEESSSVAAECYTFVEQVYIRFLEAFLSKNSWKQGK